jgi:hypothetical protein
MVGIDARLEGKQMRLRYAVAASWVMSTHITFICFQAFYEQVPRQHR